MITRIDRIFAALKVRGQKAMITYIMAGYPDYETGLAIMKTLPESGADVIELGIPFSDPIADGASIQVAGMRALRNGQTLQKTIKMVHAFRQNNNKTPVVVMGYYNPIYVYGVDRFLRDAQIAGVDGILVVDLPPEMDQELCIPAIVLQNTSGFIYYVSMTGITGQTLTNSMEIALSVKQIKAHTALPVAVGFGIKTADQVAKMSAIADGVIVGTAIINAITSTLDGQGKIVGNPIEAVDILVRNLHSSV